MTDDGESATCTESGLTEGKHCSVCQLVIEEQKVIPANGHTEVTYGAKAATCTESGFTEGTHCSVCHKVFKAQTIIPATGHTEGEWIVDQEATTSEVGSKHIECTVCGTTLKTEQIPMIENTEDPEITVDPEVPGNDEPFELVAMDTPIGVVMCPKRSEPYIDTSSLLKYTNGTAKGYQGHVYCVTDSGTVKIATLYMGTGITAGSFLGTFLFYEVRMERFYPSVDDWSEADQAIYTMVQGDYDYVADQVASIIN